jgi:hypothetical protein
MKTKLIWFSIEIVGRVFTWALLEFHKVVDICGVVKQLLVC